MIRQGYRGGSPCGYLLRQVTAAYGSIEKTVFAMNVKMYKILLHETSFLGLLRKKNPFAGPFGIVKNYSS